MSNEQLFTEQDWQFFKNNLCGCSLTAGEEQYVRSRCLELGLKPQNKEVHITKYTDKQTGQSKLTIMVTLDGFRSIAAQSGLHSGTKRTTTTDPETGEIVATCEVYRSDWAHPAVESVHLSDYQHLIGKNSSSGRPSLWAQMPRTMLKKCAEVAALRIAFSKCAGLYSPDEMPIAELQQPVLTQNAPPSEVGLGDYIGTIGRLIRDAGISQDTFKQLTGYDGVAKMVSDKLPMTAFQNTLTVLENYVASSNESPDQKEVF